ncbi:MAG: helix-turn-helix transcriptional regulator [Leptolyngbya sp. SIOISBB]|nr:helix-turn-helix transcriptional regulator [Leptolyngbya sp. SIOISBB]
MRIGNCSGSRIRARRKAQNMAQVELAAALAVEHELHAITQADISKIEQNQRSLKDYELRAIAHVLNTSMDELAGDGY